MQPSNSHDDAAKAYKTLMALVPQLEEATEGKGGGDKVLLRTSKDAQIGIEKKGSSIGRFFKIILSGKKKQYDLGKSLGEIQKLLSKFQGMTEVELNELGVGASSKLNYLVKNLNDVVIRYNSKHKSQPVARLALPFLKGIRPQSEAPQNKIMGTHRRKAESTPALKSEAPIPAPGDKRQASEVGSSRKKRRVDTPPAAPKQVVPEPQTPKAPSSQKSVPPGAAKLKNVVGNLGKSLNIPMGGPPPVKELTEEQKKAKEKAGIQTTTNILKGRARKPKKESGKGKTIETVASMAGLGATKSKELLELEARVKKLLEDAGLYSAKAGDPFQECTGFDSIKNIVKDMCVKYLGGDFSKLPEELRVTLVGALALDEKNWFEKIPTILAQVKSSATSS